MAADSAIINPMLHADSRRSSYNPVQGDLTEEVLWHAVPTDIELRFFPFWLALRPNMLIIGNHQDIIAVNAANGTLLWREPIRMLFTFMCREEGVLIHEYTKWRPYDSTEKILHHITSPDNGFITNYFRDKNGYWYGYFTMKKPSRRGQKQNHWFEFNRYAHGRNRFDWYYRATGRSLGSLYDPAGNIFYIVMPDRIHYFPPEATSEDEVKTFDVPGIETFALDHRGNLLLVVREEKGFLLKQFSGSGEQQWSVPLAGLAPGLMTKPGLNRLPPASSPHGTVYCAEPKGVVAVEDGAVKWRRELSAGTTPMHITVLADNSLLVGSVNMLHAIDTKGTITKSVTLPSVISCRPIMDTQGRVFVGGEDGVRCLQ